MLGFLAKKVFGSKSDKDVKAVLPIVAKINEEFVKLSSISDDELRNTTQKIKGVINERLKGVDAKIKALKTQVESDDSLDIHQKEDIFIQIDKLEEDRNKDLEVVLMDVLPQAFAVVKETARRYKDNKKLVVTATMEDKQIAAEKSNVTIEGDKSIWSNEWDAAGTLVTWDMVHYDVQLIGGIVLHQGKVAEMATGEGKTLVATLPAFLNALAGRGVHVITVNDYLAKRDSQWMAPLFEFHGLTIDCIDNHKPHSAARVKAYNSDITYGTNNEFGFDYLRDNMAMDVDELVQGRHHFAMIDEVDSVLVDEARTPLIISGPIPKGGDHEFYELKPLVAKLYDAQKKVAAAFLQDAKKLIKEGNEKEGGISLFRAYRGLPKNKPLIKYLGESGMRSVLQKAENIYLAENQKKMPEADAPLYFTIDEKTNNVELTEKGLDLLSEGTSQDMYVMPDIGVELDKVEKNTDLPDVERAKAKDAIIKDYTAKTQRIHSLNQLLKAYTMFEKDTDYIVDNSKVKIVDEQTGRVLDGRRYSDGLHQAIEAKENVKVEDATQTYATITLQNYFRMYHKLSGMTGTAETEAGELWEIYKLDVVVIPTNRPIVRKDLEDKVYRTVREKFNAVIEEVLELRNQNRPVLVGTTSVEISEVLSKMLNLRKIPHQVLNAKQHAKEADVVAEAGKAGTVTIATNMAGRGTDIKLTPESKAAGGLAIVGTERHDSRRVDRQLRGRSGRQGDVGSSQFFVSLEDNLMRLFVSDRVAKIMDRLGLKDGEVIQHSMITNSITRAQKKVEENNFAIRKRLLEYDDVMNSQRTVIYKRRKNALFGERLEMDVLNMIYDIAEEVVAAHSPIGDFDGFKLKVISVFGTETKISKEEFGKNSAAKLSDILFLEVAKALKETHAGLAVSTLPAFKQIQENRGDTVENIVVPLASNDKQLSVTVNLKELIETEAKSLPKAIQKYASLAIIDNEWKDHLREMDDLKQSVQNATFEQKDPLLIYKFEGFNLFQTLISRINNEVVGFLFTSSVATKNPKEIREARNTRVQQNVKEEKDEVESLTSGGGKTGQAQAPTKPPVDKVKPLTTQKVFGRNDRVNVEYTDGRVMKDVKYKSVENDITEKKCVLIEE